MSEKQKLLIVHRPYRLRGGEDVFLHEILIPNLKILNIPYEVFEPQSYSLFEILFMSLGFEKLRPTYLKLKKKLNSDEFTSILFNNFIPGISLIAAQYAKIKNIRTFAWLHNMRMTCANGLNFNGNNFCQKCGTHGSRYALIQNCHKNILQSLLYSWIYRSHRINQLVIPYLDSIICNSEFTRKNFLQFNPNLENKIKVIRMPPPSPGNPKELPDIILPYFLFIGRLSYEKGVDQFLNIANTNPNLSFVIVGSGEKLTKLGSNIVHKKQVSPEEKSWLIKNAAAVVIPSRVQETYSLVVVEAAKWGTPVIFPEGGGAEETFKLLHGVGSPLSKFDPSEWLNKKDRTPKSLSNIEVSFKNELVNMWDIANEETSP